MPAIICTNLAPPPSRPTFTSVHANVIWIVNAYQISLVATLCCRLQRVERLSVKSAFILAGSCCSRWRRCVRACDLNHAPGPRHDSESEAVQLYNRGYQV